MIVGAHSIIYSTRPEADRAFFRDVLGLPHVDVGDGWLIFGLPPAEVAFHPSGENDVHEFYLMCDDVETFVARMKRHGRACDPVQDQGYGLVTRVTLPGGGKIGVYQPRHARPRAIGAGKTAKNPRRPAERGRATGVRKRTVKKKARRR